MDIILCRQGQIDAARLCGESDERVGERLFGGDQWDADYGGKSAVTTDELYTYMDVAAVQPDGEDEPITLRFLNQQHEFLYFFRVQNREAVAQTVTARVWLVAKYDHACRPLYNCRRMWIAMDTFQVSLSAHARKVICRLAKSSSVARKSNGEAAKPQDVLRGSNAPHGTQRADAYCDCGWPYSLLLPKGREEGMMFRLMVMFTSNDINMPATEQSCGSVSLCGTRGQEYPDKRRMGYPFNRRFVDDTSIEEMIFTQPTMAARDLRITQVR